MARGPGRGGDRLVTRKEPGADRDRVGEGAEVDWGALYILLLGTDRLDDPIVLCKGEGGRGREGERERERERERKRERE